MTSPSFTILMDLLPFVNCTYNVTRVPHTPFHTDKRFPAIATIPESSCFVADDIQWREVLKKVLHHRQLKPRFSSLSELFQ